jgi:uncharacterized protein YbaR (Trm112 family)
VKPELLKIICCPATRLELRMATRAEVEQINVDIAARSLRDQGGRVVESPVESALVSGDGRLAYPIRDGLPVLLVDAALPIVV